MKGKQSQTTYALIGCGGHSQENIAPSLSLIEGIRCVWVADPKVEDGERVANLLQVGRSLVDWKDGLEHVVPDAMIVVGPPQLHEDVTEQALKFKVPIFVEKPPATCAKRFSSACAAAEKIGLVTMVGHNLRHTTAAEQFNDVLSDPEFGTPVAMEMTYFASKPKGDRWGLNDRIKSFMLSHVNHAVDFMIYQMGKIRNVSSAIVESDDNSVSLSVQFRFANGAIGNLLATSSAPHFDIRATVVSDKKRVAHLNGLNGVSVFGVGQDEKHWGRTWSQRTLDAGYKSAGYQTELQRFFDAVKGINLDDCHPTFADELDVYHAMDEINSKLSKGVLRGGPRRTSKDNPHLKVA